MIRAERERIAAKVKAMLRGMQARRDAEIALMRATVADSTDSDAVEARRMLELADEAGTSAKRERFLTRAWHLCYVYERNRGQSKGGDESKRTKQRRADRWQSAIEVRARRMLLAGLTDLNIAGRLAGSTSTERKPKGMNVETVRRYVARLRKGMQKK